MNPRHITISPKWTEAERLLVISQLNITLVRLEKSHALGCKTLRQLQSENIPQSQFATLELIGIVREKPAQELELLRSTSLAPELLELRKRIYVSPDWKLDERIRLIELMVCHISELHDNLDLLLGKEEWEDLCEELAVEVRQLQALIKYVLTADAPQLEAQRSNLIEFLLPELSFEAPMVQ